jgi:hypothetical protein
VVSFLIYKDVDVDVDVDLVFSIFMDQDPLPAIPRFSPGFAIRPRRRKGFLKNPLDSFSDHLKYNES